MLKICYYFIAYLKIILFPYVLLKNTRNGLSMSKTSLLKIIPLIAQFNNKFCLFPTTPCISKLRKVKVTRNDKI